MNTFNRYRSVQQGFSLLETLIAVVVIAVGLLAVASLQSHLIGTSADNKAKAEAMAIAQARLDQFRNYTNSVTDETGFDTLFADTSGYTNPTSINGVNAAFTRSEFIAASANTKDISVQVGWNDRHGDAQTVVMSTSLGWQPPRAVGDLARLATPPVVASPTGRARLGEGQLPTGAPTTDNGDGTELYDDGSGNLKLVVDNDIVLTLEDACQSGGGNCINFVTIKGRVYIDTATKDKLKPGKVLVAATDAGFCQRYYLEAESGIAITVTNDTSSTPITTPNHDYEYFDYTCYLGGGWHGNIGILLAKGLAQADKICQGDPVSGNAWEQPVIAARRVYRGMLYKIDGSNASGKQEDANGNILYYSIGVSDALELPDPNTSDKTHDFVISRLSTPDTTGDKCTSKGVMVRADSYVGGTAGALFTGMPTDFICLNPGNVDAYNSSVFGVDSSCPYDPSDPPVAAYVLNGTFTVATDPGETAEVDLPTVVTSDGPGNCIRGSFIQSGSVFTAPYDCVVYNGGNGWDGYIEASLTSGNTHFCVDDGSDGGTDLRINLSGVTAASSGHDFTCTVGNATLISGTVSADDVSMALATATINTAGGSCTVAADGLSYSCFTGRYTKTDWTGIITFTTTTGNVCGIDVNVDTGIAKFTSEAPGVVSRDLLLISKTNCP